jgi:hypothetical protein
MISPVLDAEEANRVLAVLHPRYNIREEPVPGYIPPTPHPYLDPVLSTEKLDKIKERVIVDQKIAAGEPLCDGCPDYSDCFIVDEASALSRCGKLNAMRARAMR